MTGDETDLDTLVIRVRADTSGFMAGVGDIRRELDGPLAQGVDRAGGSIERALARAAISGKFGFEDLRRVALTALADIAAGAVRTDLGALFGGSGGGGLLGSLASAVGGLFGGAPGRATGGPVTGGSAYMVGERGPELFVPTASGRIETTGQRGAVNVTVNVAAPREASAAVMQQTGAQVARAVRQALARADA
ncbi:MAG: tail tape measure protein [Polymorphobacter sp.]